MRVGFYFCFLVKVKFGMLKEVGKVIELGYWKICFYF